MFEIRDDIKKALKESGKTSADLARFLGKNYDVVNRWLNGRAKMPEDVDNQIREFLSDNGI